MRSKRQFLGEQEERKHQVILFFRQEKMTVTRTGALVQRKKEEQAKINAANAKSARMTQVKSRMSNLQTKIE